ncbi:MAG: lambda repressor-like predicted transcriptional regulator [Paracoccaceae bacterium]|jgi:lambda repressor-like predicted transcriptional regulator
MEKMPVYSLIDWMPDSVSRYLAHTVSGRSIRDLARQAGCHASTILRQIRRVEAWRDDPLIDAGLAALETTQIALASGSAKAGLNTRNTSKMIASSLQPDPEMHIATLEHHARVVLRRLCESDAVLAVAENMEKAVVVRDSGDGSSMRTAVVDNEIAQAMALKGWISCAKPGRISRYHITATGRSDLIRLLAKEESRASAAVGHGFAEAQAPFGAAAPVVNAPMGSKRSRFSSAESPLAALARRKNRDGSPFLNDDLVQAGERLREDFELSQVGPQVTQNWDRFLTGSGKSTPDSGTGDGPSRARTRVVGALGDLGPGLSDVALRCCCYLEGLESAEKRMGWSARSGKIVLRIALQRLKRHYDSITSQDRMMIG